MSPAALSRLSHAAAAFLELLDVADRRGLDVVRLSPEHWTFSDAATGRAVLDYFPASGRACSPRGAMLEAGDAWQALELATERARVKG